MAVAAEGVLVPTVLIAEIRNRILVPLTSPVMTAVVAELPVDAIALTQVAPLFVDFSIRYPVIGLPPVTAGAVHVTVAVASPATAAGAVGAPGTV